MALNFRGIFSGLFKQSEKDSLGVGAKGQERIWSCSGSNFIPTHPDVDNIEYGIFAGSLKNTEGISAVLLLCPVLNIPNGATVTGVTVYGTDGNFTLHKVTSSGSRTQMASAAVGTEDTSIVHEVIDNEIYNYNITIINFSPGEFIYGAKVKYTFK